MTCCVISSSLRWHAGSVTTLCEAHLTTSPTVVAQLVREDSCGICQQEGGEGAKLVPYRVTHVNCRLNLRKH